MSDTFPTPFECPLARVEPPWVDYNGHLNMAYYNVVFDQALDHAYDRLGIGEDYVGKSGCSHFTVEAHVCYLREVGEGDPLRITWQLLDWDAKRLHFFEHMYHATAGYLAATSEQMAIHVDMNARRAAPFPEVLQQRFANVMSAHASLARPEQAGRVMQIPHKTP